jgi:hypothetical protein
MHLKKKMHLTRLHRMGIPNWRFLFCRSCSAWLIFSITFTQLYRIGGSGGDGNGGGGDKCPHKEEETHLKKKHHRHSGHLAHKHDGTFTIQFKNTHEQF